MIEKILDIAFSGFWSFVGMCILLHIFVEGVVAMWKVLFGR